VEDEPTIARSLARLIHHHCHALLIDTALTLKDALEKIAFMKYDYWLIDYSLPDGTGDELLLEKDLPPIRIGMSGNQIDPAFQAQFTAFFHKPFDIASLVVHFHE